MMCCVGILILASLFVVTVSQVSITADKYFVEDGESVVFTCIVPDFTDNILVIQDGTNRALCIASSACISTDTSLYTSTKSGTTNVIFTILSFSKTRDVGSWICRYGTSTDSLAKFLYEYIAEIIACIGILFAYVVLLIFSLVPKVFIILVIFIILVWYWYFRTQKVTIKVTTSKRLIKAIYDIENDKQNQNMLLKEEAGAYIYSCVVFGGQLLTCKLNSQNGQLRLSCRISDDLLWVSNGQEVILPTTLSISARELQGNASDWTCNNKPVNLDDNIEKEGFIRLRILRVDESHFGTYKCRIIVNELEKGLLEISNMRLSGCPCKRPFRLYLILCAVVILGFDLPSVLIVALQRSNDGFCIEDLPFALTVLIPIVIFASVIVFPIRKLSMKKTGKDKSDQCCLFCNCGCAVTPSENHTERVALPLDSYPTDEKFEETNEENRN